MQALSAGGQAFTIVLILIGVGTALFTFTQGLEVVVEGPVQEVLGRRRMEREITRMSGHVIVCGFGADPRTARRRRRVHDRPAP